MDPNVVATLAEVQAEYDETMRHANALKRQMEQLEAKLDLSKPKKAAAKPKVKKSK